jgi:small ubiquitin-related modifier
MEVKPDSDKPDNRINLRVVDPNGGEVFFKIRRDMALGKLTKAYCERKGFAPGAVRFLFDGNRINDDITPEKLNMEDNDVIDVMVQQTGGNLSRE